jgi:hypothetical protein
MPLEATIMQVFAPYCLSRRHGHKFWRKNLLVALCIAFQSYKIEILLNSSKQQVS